MAWIEIPDKKRVITAAHEIGDFLGARGVIYDVWTTSKVLPKNPDQAAILDAYADQIKPYMARNGYTVADVIRVTADTPNLDAVRQKFLREHRHTEDEVRFFVEGKGYFWFNLENEDPIFAVMCEAGDFISVPKGTAHWFDMGAKPHVTAIRMFIDPSGWVPDYTESGNDERYNKPYATVL